MYLGFKCYLFSMLSIQYVGTLVIINYFGTLIMLI